MKKFFYFLTLVIGLLTAEITSSQTFLFGGLNLGGVKTSDETREMSINLRPGIDVGIGFSIPILQQFRMQLAPSFRTQSTSFTSSSLYYGEPVNYEERFTLARVVLPITMVFDYQVGEKTIISPGLGFFFGYSVSGKILQKGNIGSFSFEDEYPIKFNQAGLWYKNPVGKYGLVDYYVYNQYTYKQLDAGVDLRLTVKLNERVVFSFVRQISLNPFLSYSERSVFLRATQLSVGVVLGSKKR